MICEAPMALRSVKRGMGRIEQASHNSWEALPSLTSAVARGKVGAKQDPGKDDRTQGNRRRVWPARGKRHVGRLAELRRRFSGCRPFGRAVPAARLRACFVSLGAPPQNSISIGARLQLAKSQKGRLPEPLRRCCPKRGKHLRETTHSTKGESTRLVDCNLRLARHASS